MAFGWKLRSKGWGNPGLYPIVVAGRKLERRFSECGFAKTSGGLAAVSGRVRSGLIVDKQA